MKVAMVSHFVCVGSAFDNSDVDASVSGSVTTTIDKNDNWKIVIFADPDSLDLYFLKVAVDIIAEPIAHFFNLSSLANIIPKTAKAAYVLLLYKGGDPAELTNYPQFPNSRCWLRFLNHR